MRSSALYSSTVLQSCERWLSRIYAEVVPRLGGADLGDVFDRTWYTAMYPDVARSTLDPITHYLRYGWREGRQPHRLFDPTWYAATYLGPAERGTNPLIDYLQKGWRDGRFPIAFLDPAFYRSANSLPAATEPLAHYTKAVRSGIRPVLVPDLPAAPNREAGSAILHITHALGGGIAEHVRRLNAQSQNPFLSLEPALGGVLRLATGNLAKNWQVWVDPEKHASQLPALLQNFGIARIHIHHVLGHDHAFIRRIAEALHVPVDFTVHDYYTICPRITLTDRTGSYCGEPAPEACNRCISDSPNGATDIASWRSENAWLVTKSDRVFAPSFDTSARMKRYFPSVEITTVPDARRQPVPSMPAIASTEPLRVAVLGTVFPHKGLDVLQRSAALAEAGKLPLKFTVIGDTHLGLRGAFQVTGKYDPDQLPELLREVNPHLVWFPARCPETFSFTLSECLERGLPVAAPSIGAFPERLHGRPLTWILPWSSGAEQWLELFLSIREKYQGAK